MSTMSTKFEKFAKFAKPKTMEGYARVAACLVLTLLAGVMSIVSDSSRFENSWHASPAHAHFSATTSSTIPPDERVCTVTFRLLTEVVIGSIQFEAKYGRNVRFIGDGIDVQCEPVAGEFWVVSDSGERIDRKTKLRAGMVDSQGVSGPADLLACRLRFADTVPSDDDVNTPVVTEATGTDAMVLHPFPKLDVRFDCPMGTTTTNTTTTTQTTTTTLVTGTPRCGHPVDRCGLLPSATDALVPTHR
jgi:hypothetical protein